MNIFKKFYLFLRFRYAVQMADKAHAKDNTRYFVIPDEDGKLVVMDRKNFRILRKKHYLPSGLTLKKALEMCVYRTPDGGERGGLDPEDFRQGWKNYLEFVRVSSAK